FQGSWAAPWPHVTESRHAPATAVRSQFDPFTALATVMKPNPACSDIIVVALVWLIVLREAFVWFCVVCVVWVGLRRLVPEHGVDGALGALGTVLDEVGVGAQGEAWVGVTEVFTQGLDRLTFMERCAGVE